MRNIIIYGLAGYGALNLTCKVGGYMLKKHRKEIKETVVKHAVEFIFEDEEQPDKATEPKEDDPLKAALYAYLKVKGA